jgi:hypothetical protein
VIYEDDRVVARISSVVGLATALRGAAEGEGQSDGAVSFAGVVDGAQWLSDWVSSGGARTIDVLEKDRQRKVRLHVSRLIDPLLTGETYEALVESAETIEGKANGNDRPPSDK